MKSPTSYPGKPATQTLQAPWMYPSLAQTAIGILMGVSVSSQLSVPASLAPGTELA